MISKTNAPHVDVPTPPIFKTITGDRLKQLEAIEQNADLLCRYLTVFFNKQDPTPYDVNNVITNKLHLEKFIGLKSSTVILPGALPHNPLASQLLAALLSVVYSQSGGSDGEDRWMVGVHGDTPAPEVVGEAIEEAARQGITT
jgi:hypothetical protein